MNDRKINRSRVSSSGWRKHSPASTWYFINPSPWLHPGSLASPQKQSHLFNASLFGATTCFLQMSSVIIHNNVGWSSDESKRDICNHSMDGDGKKRKIWLWVRRRVRRWLRDEGIYNVQAVSITCEKLAEAGPPTYTSSQTLHLLPLLFWRIQGFPIDTAICIVQRWSIACGLVHGKYVLWFWWPDLLTI